VAATRVLEEDLDELTCRLGSTAVLTPMAALQALPDLATLHGPVTYHWLYGSESTG